MQARHKDPAAYFEEQALSCRKYYVPYITQNSDFRPTKSVGVLEIGCGIGGVLSVFAEHGCSVTGVDINGRSIERARDFFAAKGLKGVFVCSDVFDFSTSERFDLIIMHDALEHIPDKERLMFLIKGLLKPDGILYLGFPAWQMPFGGHQQMSKSRLLANLPYVHLLPRWLFRAIFRAFGQSESDVRSWFNIRDTGISIEGFERLVKNTGYRIVDRTLWFINPNYETKFGLRPRKLPPLIARVPWLRNFFSTTCYYLLAASPADISV